MPVTLPGSFPAKAPRQRKDNDVVVDPELGPFTSVKQAVDYLISIGPHTEDDPATVTIVKGVVTEPTTPIDVPPNVHIRGTGDGLTIIEPSNPVPPVFTDSSPGDKTIADLTIRNMDKGVYITGDTNLKIENVILQDPGDVGIENDSTDGDVQITNVLVKMDTNCNYGVRVDGGGVTSLDNVRLEIGPGVVVTDGIRIENGPTEVKTKDITMTVDPGGTLDSGISLNDSDVKIEGNFDILADPGGTLNKGVDVNVQGEVKIEGNLDILNADIGFDLDDSPDTKVVGVGGSFNIRGPNTTRPVNFQNESNWGGVLAVASTAYDPQLVNGIPNGLRIPSVLKVDEVDDDNNIDRKYQDFAVGSWENPRNTWLAGGPTHVDNVVVLTNNNVESPLGFTDVTDLAINTPGTYEAPGNGAGNTIYYGWKDAPIPGYTLANTATNRVGGTVVYEIWNGASWVNIGLMALSFRNLEHRGDRPGMHNEIQSVMFNQQEADIATTTQTPKVLIGSGLPDAYYWVRERIVAPVTQRAVYRRWGSHSKASQRLTKDGISVYEGGARKRKQVAIQLAPDGVGTAPNLIQKQISPQIYVEERAGFLNGVDMQLSVEWQFPKDFDFSSPFQFKLYFAQDAPGVGDIVWDIVAAPKRNQSMDGNPVINPDLVGALAESSLQVIEPVSGTQDQMQEVVFPERQVSNYRPGDSVALLLRRTGSSGSDTYSSLVKLFSFEIDYTQWL
jgi:hypothetical protein